LTTKNTSSVGLKHSRLRPTLSTLLVLMFDALFLDNVQLPLSNPQLTP